MQKDAKETLCFRNVLLMKSLQFTFINKQGINKKIYVNNKFLLKRKVILEIKKKV